MPRRLKRFFTNGVIPLIGALFSFRASPLLAMLLLAWAVAQSGSLGVRFAMTVSAEGGPMLRLIRQGPAVEGLAAGAMLIATETIGGGIFYRSVVLITRHDRATGTEGFIINAPLADPRHGALYHALAVEGAPDAVRHGVGGPVGLPAAFEVLHAFAALPGATEVAPGCWVGGLPRLQAAMAAAATTQARAGEAPTRLLAQALYGRAAWAPLQLEGEPACPKRANWPAGRPGALHAALWDVQSCAMLLGRRAASVLFGLAGEIHAGAWHWVPGLGPRFALDPNPSTIWARAMADVTGQNFVGG